MMHINLSIQLEEILQVFFKEDLKKLIDKYQSVNKGQGERIQQLLETLRNNRRLHQLDMDLDLALELAEEEDHIAQLYFWLKQQGMRPSIEEVKEYIREIESDDYMEVGDFVLTFEDINLSKYTREKLLELVEDSYHVEKFFDKEQLIEMWLEETSREDAVEELMKGVSDPHVELLELDFEEVCTCRDGRVVISSITDF